MAFKFIAFFALIASSAAGVLDTQHAYSDATQVSYSSVSSPVATHAAPTYAKIAAPAVYAAPAFKVAAPLAYSAPIAKTVYAEEKFAPAHYDFGYAVEDPHTGDSKTHHETREGDVVKGSYSLIEADGTKRIVEYTVDAHSGFNAVVNKEPAQGSPTVAKVAAPVYAAPAYKVAAPVYSAPAYKVAAPVYSAPAYKVAAPVYSAPAYKVAAPVYSAPAYKVATPVYSAPAYKVAAPVVAKIPAVTKVTYSSAPDVSYSSVSAPLSHEASSYYH